MISNNKTKILLYFAFLLFTTQASAEESIVLVNAVFNENQGLSLVQAVKGFGEAPDYLLEKSSEFIRVGLSRNQMVEKTIYLIDPRYKKMEYVDAETGGISAVNSFDSKAKLTAVLPADYDYADFYDSNSTLLFSLNLRTLTQATPTTPQVQEIMPEKRSDSLPYAGVLLLGLLALVAFISIAGHVLKRSE